MKLITVLTLLVASAMAMENLTIIEEFCTNCTAVGDMGFYKIMWQSSSPPEYVCRSTATIASKFGVIVDRACTPFDCLNIESRAFSKSVSAPVTCGNFGPQTYPAEHGTVTYVRDLMEIILITIFLFGLIIRGQWLKGIEALQKRRKLRQDIINTLYSPSTQEFADRMKQAGGIDEVDKETT